MKITEKIKVNWEKVTLYQILLDLFLIKCDWRFIIDLSMLAQIQLDRVFSTFWRCNLATFGKLNISWPMVPGSRDDQWNWIPECEQYPCSPRCIINSTKSYQEVATGEKTWFCSMSFSTDFVSFSAFWQNWWFLKGFFSPDTGTV